jgi:hypothetical protein
MMIRRSTTASLASFVSVALSTLRAAKSEYAKLQ